jgi:acetoacetyl-CoA synthetase
MEPPIWTPDAARVRNANLTEFTRRANALHGIEATSYDDLHAWSVREPAAFWEQLWHYAGLRASQPWSSVLEAGDMRSTRWFTGARLNFAENLLRHRDDRTALVVVDERRRQPQRISYAELHRAVARLARFLRDRGVGPGDRVAGYLPNCGETVIAMLAATSLGAVWSSCSPDFGSRSVRDRFGQIGPKVLLAADGYRYNGKVIRTLERTARLAREIDAIEQVIVVPFLGERLELVGLDGAVSWVQALDNDAETIDFVQLPFDHPVYILYSSGTTGVPKCIVHGAGGTLLQHAKEHLLHTDLKRDDVLFYFTTCGWMMWNWLVGALGCGATVVLYDGSPGHPDLGVLWRLVEELGITVFGTSPKFLASCAAGGLHPGRDHDLSSLHTLLSTGAPLSREDFAWVYREVKADLLLASISGGTDIVSCFMLGCPTEPVYAGEIQKRGLGMKVEAWDEAGAPVVGTRAELVCTAPFPSMPVGFWNDPDGARYDAAYFQRYPGVWHHGDFIEITPRGGVVVHGRSDATLNPGGVRIGTAEIYRQVEALDEVVDSLVVGRTVDHDVEVILFVVLRAGAKLDAALVERIKAQIREHTTPRHVPRRILALGDIPRTLNGKKVELAVRDLLDGRPVTNRDTLANPEALDEVAAVAQALC